jgi:hypothetical protein
MAISKTESALRQVKYMPVLGLEYEETSQDRLSLTEVIMARDIALLLRALAATSNSKKSTAAAA